MSVDMYVSESEHQAASIAIICRQQKQGYEQLQQSINEFVLDSESLSGATYDSAKQFFEAVLLPLAKAGILLSEAVMEACQKFPEMYLHHVDCGDLKESELREKIAQINYQLSELTSLEERMHTLLYRQQEDGLLERSVPARMSTSYSLMGSYIIVKTKLEEKLEKLLAFNQNSPALFAEIEVLKQAVSQGAELANTSWHIESSKFVMPKSKELVWAKTVNEEWEKNEKRTLAKKEDEWGNEKEELN